MKLIIDCRAITLGYHNGLSRFTESIVTELLKLMPVTVMVFDKRQLLHLPKGTPYIMGPHYSIPSQRTVTTLLNAAKADVVFAPTVFFTLGKRNFKLISSLHDTNGFDVKHIFAHEAPINDKLIWHTYHATKVPQRATLNTSDHIITVSESAKQSILRHKLTVKPISVVYNAPVNLPHVTHDPHSKTLVYMGTFFVYKNVKTLVKAMNHLPGYTLICLSRITPKTKRALLKLANDPTQIVFKNGVTDEEYHATTAGAAALVTASTHEGFGLPLVEAQAMGVPVVCSDIPVFHEVCGDGALYFDHRSAEDFAKRIREVPKKSAALIAAGHQNARRFTWKNSAKVLYGVIQNVAKQ